MDYYQILGVSRQTSFEEIKKAYRSLALEHHPDRNPEKDRATCEEKLKEINEAYAVLKDPEKRALYDRTGQRNEKAQESAQGAAEFFDELLREMMKGVGFGPEPGSGPRRRSRQRDSANTRPWGAGDWDGRGGTGDWGPWGAAERKEQNQTTFFFSELLTLEEVARGATRSYKIVYDGACPPCKGTGSRSKKKKNPCSTCQGEGIVIDSRGIFEVSHRCRACDGKGFVVKNPCKHCGGWGSVEQSKEVPVVFPPGCFEAMELTFDSDLKTADGEDIEIVVQVDIQEHDLYGRDEQDIYTKKFISFPLLVLGGKIDVDLLDGGKVTVKIPDGTQPGKVFRLKKKGLPHVEGEKKKGDLFIEVHVDVPCRDELTQEELKFLKKLEKSFRDRYPI